MPIVPSPCNKRTINNGTSSPYIYIYIYEFVSPNFICPSQLLVFYPNTIHFELSFIMQDPYASSNSNTKDRPIVDAITPGCSKCKFYNNVKEQLIKCCIESYIKMGRVENHILWVKDELIGAQQTLFNEIGSILFNEAQNAMFQLVNAPVKETSESSNYDTK